MRAEFDLDPGLIYLNSGTHSICPRSVIEAQVRLERDFEKNPTAALFGAWERLWDVQVELGRFVNADPLDLFLRPNVTVALNVYILGMPMPKGGEILVSDMEYGAVVNACRYRAERDGMSLRAFSVPKSEKEFEGLTSAKLAERVLAELRPETRMLLLSQVITGNGLVMPIREIARETRKRGVLLVVDGAHGPGAFPVDLSTFDDVDFYGGNLHKWAMGPKGTAFGWVPKRHHAALKPIEAGWTTFEVPATFQGFAGGDLFQGRMLMSASYNFAPYYALKDTFAFWNRHGQAKIHARLRELQAHTAREVKRILGWASYSPPVGPLSGPLQAYVAPDSAQAPAYGWMFRLHRDHRLQIGSPPIQGRHCLRLSPHVYNTEDEITRGLEIIARDG